MGDLKKSIEVWGEKNIGSKNLRKVLRHLCKLKKGEVTAVAEELGTTAQAMRYWLKKFSLVKDGRDFESLVKEAGYESLGDFFTDPRVARKTYKQIADEFGVKYPTVSRWYAQFMERRKGGAQ